MIAHAIDAGDPAWSAPSPTLRRPVLAVGTEVTLHGYHRPLVHRELAWLHAALTARLGRGHDMGGPESSLRVQSWSVVPWPCPSGCGVVWWDEADGTALARTRATSRIGRVPVELELGSAVRIHSPPMYLPGAYPVRVHARSLVVVARTVLRDRPEGMTKRQARATGAAVRREAHASASVQAIESGLWSLARKLRVPMDYAPRVHVIADRTRPASVYMRGKPGRVEGWEGQVDVLASAPARWLLECAARGLGLGARGAYGCGAVAVESLEGR